MEGRIICESLSSRMNDWTYFSVKNDTEADAWNLKEKKKLTSS